MRMVFLNSMVNHARYCKRIHAIEKLGVRVKVLAFERDSYPSKNLPGEYISLGRINHGQYLRRLLILLSSTNKVRRALRITDVLYTFGLDMLILGWLALLGKSNRPKLIYEVGDIREILFDNSFAGGISRSIERFFVKRIDLLVSTSPAYISGYYKNVLGLHNLCFQVIENKLDANQVRTEKEHLTPLKPDNKPLVIGYFGVLRCTHSWEILKMIARESKGRVRIYVRGVPKNLKTFTEDLRSLSEIEYAGPYLSPDDLSSIYGQVDLIWAAHHHGKSNLLWSRVCRFYEACFFRKPMIVQGGTQDSLKVEKYGLGISVDLADVSGTTNSVLAISAEELTQWQKNFNRVPEDVYLYTNEHERLVHAIQRR